MQRAIQKVDEAAQTRDRLKHSTLGTRVSKRRAQTRAVLYLILALVLTLAWFGAFRVFNVTVFFVNLLLVCAVISDRPWL